LAKDLADRQGIDEHARKELPHCVFSGFRAGSVLNERDLRLRNRLLGVRLLVLQKAILAPARMDRGCLLVATRPVRYVLVLVSSAGAPEGQTAGEDSSISQHGSTD
jgi:hypothetical protein